MPEKHAAAIKFLYAQREVELMASEKLQGMIADFEAQIDDLHRLMKPHDERHLAFSVAIIALQADE